MSNDSQFSTQIEAKARRKVRAQSHKQAVWFGLGMVGLIGWSVVLPTLAGAAVGRWLDGRHPGTHSWTLALLVAGLLIGCFSAWNWIQKEDKAMRDEQKGPDV